MVVILSLTGCWGEEKKHLNVGTNQWLGYETLYLGRSLGYFEQTPIRLVELGSATAVSQAFRNQVLDVAALTLDEVLTLMQTEDDLRVILILDISNGADALLVKPDIKQLSDLKGKRVGVESSAVGAILLSAVLDKAKLSVSDIDIVSLTVNNHLEAYRKGGLDAVVSFEPVKTKLIQEGAHSLFDSRQINGQIVDVLVTRQSVINERPELLNELIQGQMQALSYLTENPQDAINSMRQRLGLSYDEFLTAYNGLELPGYSINKELMAGSEPKLLKTLTILRSLMLDKNLLRDKPTVDQLIDDRFIQ